MRNGDFVALVRELCEGAAVFLAGQPQLTFHYRLPDQPVITAFDPVEMSNALLHLLLNAAASRREGTPLTLRLTLTVEGETLHLALSDDGIGIPPDILAHICEPYVSRTAGIGLGLPLVRGILAAHGGTLAIESTPGTGPPRPSICPSAPIPICPTMSGRRFPSWRTASPPSTSISRRSAPSGCCPAAEERKHKTRNAPCIGTRKPIQGAFEICRQAGARR